MITRYNLRRTALIATFATSFALMVAYSTPLSTQAPTQSSAPRIAITNVSVIPMDTERVIADQTVLLEKGVIIKIGASSKTKVPANTIRIDGRGKYLIPGLADMHTHISATLHSTGRYDSAEVRSRLFRTWVSNGVTVIRNADYLHPGQFAWFKLTAKQLLWWRDYSISAATDIPRIFTSGPWGPYTFSFFTTGTKEPDTIVASKVNDYVKAYKAEGWDFLKVHDEPTIVMDSLIASTKREGVVLMGHGVNGYKQTLNGAFRSTEHLVGYRLDPNHPDTAKFKAVASEVASPGLWHCPTMAMSGAGNIAFAAFVKELHNAGAPLLLGTDYPLGRTVHDEMDSMVFAAKLTPYQALRTGTVEVARYFAMDDKTGTVTEGKSADLILLDSNPLVNIHHARQIAGVVLRGHWIPRAEIDRRLSILTEGEQDKIYTDYLDALVNYIWKEAETLPELGIDKEMNQRQLTLLKQSRSEVLTFVDSLLLDSVIAPPHVARIMDFGLGRPGKREVNVFGASQFDGTFGVRIRKVRTAAIARARSLRELFPAEKQVIYDGLVAKTAKWLRVDVGNAGMASQI